MVVATYVIAPIPNWLCGRAANRDDFMESTGNGVVDFGRFFTGFLVVMGIGKSMQDEGEQRAGRYNHYNLGTRRTSRIIIYNQVLTAT
jgi:hypothetical protein